MNEHYFILVRIKEYLSVVMQISCHSQVDWLGPAFCPSVA